MLGAEASLVALSQFQQCGLVLHIGCDCVIQKCSFRLLLHSVALLVHHAQEVISLGVFLVLCDDFSAVPIDLCQLVLSATVDVAEQKLDVHYSSLDVAFLGGSSDQVSGFYLVIFDEFALVIDKSQVVKRFDILCLRCEFQILQTLLLVLVLLVAEEKGGQVVQSSWEILFRCFFVVIVSFVKVRLKDGSIAFLIFEPIFIEISHVS